MSALVIKTDCERCTIEADLFIRLCPLHAAAPAMVETLQAICARINGEFDNPALVKQGLLGLDSLEEMKKMAERAIAAAERR